MTKISKNSSYSDYRAETDELPDLDLEEFYTFIAAEVKERVKLRTPVLTGRAQASWVADATKEGFVVGNTQFYTKFLENGSKRHRAPKYPNYMLRTTMEEIPQILEKYAREKGIN